MAFALILINNTTSAFELPEEIDFIKKLDKKTSQLSSKIYHQLASLEPARSTTPQNLKQLYESVIERQSENQMARSIALIRKEVKLFESEVSLEFTPKLIEELLTENDFETANTIYSKLLSNGDTLIEAKVAILFAEYFNDRKEWNETLKILDIDLEQLTTLDISRASMVKGIALQNLKQHRQATTMYRKIDPTSPLFNTAQLNIAVAHIRQDWWSDAHSVINQLLNSKNKVASSFQDRLYLMLGYSLLNKEYFRESREAFRNISLEGQYTNKAIMGLILTAISQGDNAGALNTLSILNKKKSFDLVVEETYLLLPHLYQRLEQYSAANTAYLNAIAYYEDRISKLTTIDQFAIEKQISILSKNNSQVVSVMNTQLKLTELYPELLINNIKHLVQLKKQVSSQALLKELDSLLKEHKAVFELAVNRLIDIRLRALNSYLSQSNYGLAQLYDSNDD